MEQQCPLSDAPPQYWTHETPALRKLEMCQEQISFPCRGFPIVQVTRCELKYRWTRPQALERCGLGKIGDFSFSQRQCLKCVQSLETQDLGSGQNRTIKQKQTQNLSKNKYHMTACTR